MLGKQIAHGQHISVEMHGALRLPRSATGKCNQAHVVSAGGTCLKRFGMFGHAGFYTFVVRTSEPQDLMEGCSKMRMRRIRAMRQLFCQQAVAQRCFDLCFVQYLLQLRSPKQRHGGHHHQTRLQCRQETRRHHGAVATAQQQSLARFQAHVVNQHMGDLIHLGLQLRISPTHRASGIEPTHRHPIASALRHMLI